MTDQREYMQEYRQSNKEKIAERTKRWHEANPEKQAEYARKYRQRNKEAVSQRAKIKRASSDYVRDRDRKYRELSVKTFLSHKFSQLKKERHRNKVDPKYQCEIVLEDLLNLWELQSGKCAITGKQMTHRKNSLYGASVDRIDSSIGYVKGNIQLVCQAINFAKNKYTNEEFVHFWNEETETN